MLTCPSPSGLFSHHAFLVQPFLTLLTQQKKTKGGLTDYNHVELEPSLEELVLDLLGDGWRKQHQGGRKEEA